MAGDNRADVLPIPTRVAKGRIFSFAEQVADKLGVKPGDRLEPVIGALGGRIVYGTAHDQALRAAEAIVVRSARDFTIYLPATTSVQRDRFTVAHELGHLLLHFPKVVQSSPGSRMVATRWVDMSDADAQRAEWEANWFAAGFLMPDRDFGAHVELLSISALSSRYGVSEQAIEIRKKAFGRG